MLDDTEIVLLLAAWSSVTKMQMKMRMIMLVWQNVKSSLPAVTCDSGTWERSGV